MYSKVVLPISVIVLIFAAACASEDSVPSSAPKEYIVNNLPGRTFWGAWRFCHSRGQRLATVMSAAESELLERTIGRNDFPWTRYWIGATDQGAEGKWIWISTGHNIDLEHGYTNWGKNQPDNADNAEQCVQVGYVGGVIWNDISCSNKAAFICERTASNSAKNLINTQDSYY